MICRKSQFIEYLWGKVDCINMLSEVVDLLRHGLLRGKMPLPIEK